MYKLPENISGDQIKLYLEEAADQVREESYFRPYEPSELNQARELHTQLSLELEDIVDSFSDARKEYNDSVKNKRQEIKDNLKNIRLRGVQENGKVYLFKDYEDQTVTTFNPMGVVINTRAMTPEERQMAIRVIKNVEGL